MTVRIALGAMFLLPAFTALAQSSPTTIALEVGPPQKHSVSGSIANVYIGNHSLRTEVKITISCSALDARKQVIETRNTIANNVFPGQVAYSNVHFDAPSDKIDSISCEAASAAR